MDILLGSILLLVITVLYNYVKKEIYKRRQHVFMYCPKCDNELIKNGTIIELCNRCGNISFWDIAHYPVPVLRTCADCIHMELNNCGEATCEENCSPNTQIHFKY